MYPRIPKRTLALTIVCFGCVDQSQLTTVSQPDKRPPQPEGLYLSTATQSAARASLLPTVGSEDVSEILGAISTPAVDDDASDDYLPNPAVQWVVKAEVNEPLAATEVAGRFGRAWRDKHGSFTIFGRNAVTGHWTYLVSADGPSEVDALQFAWDYYPAWSEDAVVASSSTYEKRLKAIQAELGNLAECKVVADVTPTEASDRAKTLRTLADRFDRSVSIRLAAPAEERFPGRELWDVMLCLGLRWGDMDCFHWNNPSDVGDDFFFSVWTSTVPGYFLPEEVSAGRVNVEDLLFGYSLPRSADPVTVFDKMLSAARYAQKRLGGGLTAADGSPLNVEATRNEIRSIAGELSSLGFPPGSDNALQQF